MGAPPPERLRQSTPEPRTHTPGTPPVPPGNNYEADVSEIKGARPRYVNNHTPLPCAQFFNNDAYAKDRKCNKDFNPNVLTVKGTSTG